MVFIVQWNYLAEHERKHALQFHIYEILEQAKLKPQHEPEH